MKLNRWKGDGEQRKEYFERTSASSFRIVKKKKKKEKSVAQVTHRQLRDKTRRVHF